MSLKKKNDNGGAQRKIADRGIGGHNKFNSIIDFMTRNRPNYDMSIGTQLDRMNTEPNIKNCEMCLVTRNKYYIELEMILLE